MDSSHESSVAREANCARSWIIFLVATLQHRRALDVKNFQALDSMSSFFSETLAIPGNIYIVNMLLWPPWWFILRIVGYTFQVHGLTLLSPFIIRVISNKPTNSSKLGPWPIWPPSMPRFPQPQCRNRMIRIQPSPAIPVFQDQTVEN